METHLGRSWRAVRASGIPQWLVTGFFPSVRTLGAFHSVYIIVVNCPGLVPPRLGTCRDTGSTPPPTLPVKGSFLVVIVTVLCHGLASISTPAICLGLTPRTEEMARESGESVCLILGHADLVSTPRVGPPHPLLGSSRWQHLPELPAVPLEAADRLSNRDQRHSL